MTAHRFYYTISFLCLAMAYLLSVANLAATNFGCSRYSKANDDYSYIDYDYPENYPMEELKPVFLTVEESVHYPLDGSQALFEWSSSAPSGTGFVRLGPTHRTLCVSMFHRLHCLRYIRDAIVHPGDPSSSIYHSHHCLNYIRQSILCNPDRTLEPFDPLDHDFGVDRVGVTHVCRDWGAVYAEMSRNWEDWQSFWDGEA